MDGTRLDYAKQNMSEKDTHHIIFSSVEFNTTDERSERKAKKKKIKTERKSNDKRL